MNSALLQAFKTKYEALAGVVHVVDGPAAALTAIAAVLKDTNAKRIACADLPPDLLRAVESHCAEHKIECLKQPYSAATLPDAIDQAEVGLSGADFAIAPMGAFVEMTCDDAVRLISSLPRTHIAVIHADTIFPELLDAAPRVQAFYENNPRHAAVSFISGPSRTGDIEMRLTLGVHGPIASHVIVLPASPSPATAAAAAPGASA